ncbi:hypothetical protein IFM89_035810 [Coptis chinensis]|uniref:NB-ARC domain-containing protein n=1 Tax=Coptis chinensis TaxID=261450 RepID=A0A835I399_9MAGN|nr:hypothetical protein IFM89_035810 [Coptis chinensis]
MAGIPLPNEHIGCKMKLGTCFLVNVIDRSSLGKAMSFEHEYKVWEKALEDLTSSLAQTHGIHSIARQMVRECDYVPALITSLGTAMGFEHDNKVWEKALEELTSSLAKIQGMEEKNKSFENKE